MRPSAPNPSARPGPARALRLPRVLAIALLAPLLAGVAFLASPSLAADAERDALQAGFAVEEVTPEKPVPLAGYAERGGALSTGVHDALRTRAAVFQRGPVRIAIVSVDVAAVPASLAPSVRKGLDLDALLLAATGTRSGPGGLMRAPMWRAAMGPPDADVEARLATKVRTALERAVADLRPARIGFRRVRAEGLAKAVVAGVPEPATDDTVGVLRVEAPDGTFRGALVHFAARGALLGPQNRLVSADWPGALCAAIERDAGGTALFLNGGSADVAPLLADADAAADPFERVKAYGEALAAPVVAAIRSHEIPTTDRVDIAGAECVERVKTAAGSLLAPVPEESDSTYPLPIARCLFGTLDLIGVPAMPSHRAAHAMGQGHTTWIVSAAGDHAGNLLDQDLFRRGDFEPETTWLGPEVVESLLHAPGHASPSARAAEPDAEVVRIRAEGGARAVGVAHGRRLGDEIRDFAGVLASALREEALRQGRLSSLEPLVRATGLPPGDLVVPSLVLAARRLQRHVPADLLDEMEGVAEGADVAYDRILLENTFLTLTDLPGDAALIRMAPRCTNVVAFGEATTMGQVLHGSTLDWGFRDALKDRAVCMVVEPAEGHPFVSVAWPGMVGTLRAMGAQGIAISEESCPSPEGAGLDGMPVNLLMRQVVQRADGLDDAVRRVRETPGTGGYRVTISDGQRLDARVVERTPEHGQVRKPVAGLLFGCDPDAGPECFDGTCDPAIPRDDPSSARRYPAARSALAVRAGRIDGTVLTTALLPRTSPSTPSEDPGAADEVTLAACLFEPATLGFRVAFGDDADPERGVRWHAHALLDHLSGHPSRYAPPLPVTAVGEVEVKERAVPLGGTTVLDVVMASPAPSGEPAVDRIVGQLFRPKDARGVVILMPPWKLDSLAGERLTAMTFAAKGIACFVLPLPGQVGRVPPGARAGEWTLSANLARTRRSLLQGAADTARVSLWLEQAQGFPPAKQGVMGVSLGGHVAAIAFGAYPDRFRCGAFVLAGANVERSFLAENGTTDGVRRRLFARGVTIDDVRPLVADVDPGRYGRPEGRDHVLLIAGREDPVVPPQNVEDLAAAWGGARIEWYDGDHYGLLAHIGGVYRTLTEYFLGQFAGPVASPAAPGARAVEPPR